MAVRRVLKMGDPLLYRQADPVSVFSSPELDALIVDMFDTQRDAQQSRLDPSRDLFRFC